MSFPYLSVSEISKILDLTLPVSFSNFPEQHYQFVSTDTRELSQGDVFVALKGENFDGHDFIPIAIAKGAAALITERPCSVEILKQLPNFVVKDTLSAYQAIACWWRSQFQIPVIAVTGSVGKTSTKELIAAVLASQGEILKTQLNYNNEIGVPKTLLQLKPIHRYAVIEMGMRATGEIAQLTQIAQPTIGIITNVGTAHIGRLGSEEAIAAAKCELLANLEPQSLGIINYDNPLLRATAKQVWQGEMISFGLQGGDIQGELVDEQTLKVENRFFPLPLKGKHQASNYLAAIALAKVFNLDLSYLEQGVKVELPSGRAKTHQLPGDIWLLDESYNAGLESMLAALDLLKSTPGQRHLAVLGTMKELGEYSSLFHHRVGSKVRDLGIDQLLLLVDEPVTEAIAAGAQGVKTTLFTNAQDLIAHLQSSLEPGDRLLFKASHSVGLDRVVQSLVNDLKASQ